MTEIIAIITLSVLCIAQLVERYFYTKKMLKQVDDAIKAALSRNLSEYLSASSIDDVKKKPFVQSDETLLEDADEETFNKFIKLQTQ